MKRVEVKRLGPVSDGNLGRYVNEMLDRGYVVVVKPKVIEDE